MDNTSNPRREWTWNWTSGGYNTCWASTLEEAVAFAIDLGTPRWGGTQLTPDLRSFRRIGTNDNIASSLPAAWR